MSDSALMREAANRIEELEAEIDFLNAQLEAWQEMAPPPEKNLLRKRLEERRNTRSDKRVQAAVAAALTEAAGVASYHQDWGDVQSAILALIPKEESDA